MNIIIIGATSGIGKALYEKYAADGNHNLSAKLWILYLQFDFFSEYKFRKRDSSLILKTKEGKQIIELDHWVDVAKSSIVTRWRN